MAINEYITGGRNNILTRLIKKQMFATKSLFREIIGKTRII